METLTLPGNGATTNVRTFRAPPRAQEHRFGTTPPRIERIDVVGPDCDYDPKIAYLTSVISGWAYSDADTMGRQLGFYGLPECSVREFQVTNRAMLIVAAAYFVRSADGRVGVLAFRGTVPDDFVNWLTDANTSLKNFSFGRVHTGFFTNVQPLWSGLMGTLEDALKAGGDGQQKPLENLYITGHSLGAAMAVLAGARLCTNEYRGFQGLIRGVYTFGQPAVGDREFGEHYGARFKLYRHVYRGDVVPHLPPASVGPYCHFGQEFFADEKSGWQNKNPPKAKLAALATVASLSAGLDFFSRRVVLLRRFKLPYSLDDHGPEGYIQASRLSLG